MNFTDFRLSISAVFFTWYFCHTLYVCCARYRKFRFLIGVTIQTAGAICNDIAYVANGWTMPVDPKYGPPLDSGHSVLTTASRFPELCDIYVAGSSFGDWMLLGGGILTIAMVYANRTARKVATV